MATLTEVLLPGLKGSSEIILKAGFQIPKPSEQDLTPEQARLGWMMLEPNDTLTGGKYTRSQVIRIFFELDQIQNPRLKQIEFRDRQKYVGNSLSTIARRIGLREAMGSKIDHPNLDELMERLGRYEVYRQMNYPALEEFIMRKGDNTAFPQEEVTPRLEKQRVKKKKPKKVVVSDLQERERIFYRAPMLEFIDPLALSDNQAKFLAARMQHLKREFLTHGAEMDFRLREIVTQWDIRDLNSIAREFSIERGFKITYKQLEDLRDKLNLLSMDPIQILADNAPCECRSTLLQNLIGQINNAELLTMFLGVKPKPELTEGKGGGFRRGRRYSSIAPSLGR